MNMNRLPDYIDHMQQATADACGFVVGMTRDEFEADKKTQQAVIMSRMAHQWLLKLGAR